MFSLKQLLSIGNVASSLFLGLGALVLSFVYFPDFVLGLMRGAASIRERIVSFAGNSQYEIAARTVLHESSIVLMGFTLAARVVTGVLLTFVHGLFSRDA